MFCKYKFESITQGNKIELIVRFTRFDSFRQTRKFGPIGCIIPTILLHYDGAFFILTQLSLKTEPINGAIHTV